MTVVNVPIPAFTVPVVVKLLLLKSIASLADIIEPDEKVKFLIVPIPIVSKFPPILRFLPISKLVFGFDNEAFTAVAGSIHANVPLASSAFNIYVEEGLFVGNV